MKQPAKTDNRIIFRILFSIGLIGASVLLLALSIHVSGFADGYSTVMYQGIVETAGRAFGIVPFSVVEILLYIFILMILWWIIRIINKKDKASFFLFLTRLVLIASILMFLFVLNCGINYHKTSFAESTGLYLDKYTTEELAEVCMILTAQVNACADLTERDQHGTMVHDEMVQQSARAAMENLAEDYPVLKGYYPMPKKLLFPWILSVQQITGIYSPFTVEANYNQAITDYNVPFSACHELSHLRGFMQEEEANFIAYLACIKSDEIDFKYSGSLRGWISCMNMLYRTDAEKWDEIRVLLHPAVEADLQANREFWDQYDGKIAQYAEKVNDQYLKANGQNDGIQSYGRMADLIVAYYINA